MADRNKFGQNRPLNIWVIDWSLYKRPAMADRNKFGQNRPLYTWVIALVLV